ncbi:MAG: patatin-like phospholipase family protein [Sulfuricaulis sp.]|uniref:patatin-like phospholipase family protein n=1 Tax=Sulfuricaulis sp. TaxID=2003553 RepID=UPI0034A461E8
MEPQNNPPHGKNGLVLALSGGGAAGLAHIGVIQVLAENDIPVRAVVGTSIGAEIGAFMASGMQVDELVSLATAFDWKQTLQLFMPDLPTGGLVSGKKIMDFLNTKLGKRHIESLHIGYAAITTDLETGEQVVLDCGGLVDAVRASISLPGLIAPHCIGSRWLVDGSVLNPVPFDVARERFGGPVVAVAVHSAARRHVRHPRQPRSRQLPVRIRQLLRQPWMARARGLEEWLETQLENYQKTQDKKQWWTARRVLDQVLDITQAEIVRLRWSVNPQDLMLVPEVGRVGTVEFYRAKEAIAAGRAAAQEKLMQIKCLLDPGTNQ